MASDILNSCGCCEGISVEVPAMIYNRPGLKKISYRIGNHASFKKALMARLTGSGKDVLRKLTTRDNNDFTIALFDTWSMLADVLTFYQERIANESFLETSTERQSVLELARLLGYELKPGVAAGVYIAFNLENTPGALTNNQKSETAEPLSLVNIDAGIKIQSIPGPGEKAQVFETLQKIEARPEWNSIKPLLYQPQTISHNNKLFYIRGITSGCKKGDVILIVEKNCYYLNRVTDIKQDTTNDSTCIYFEEDAVVPSYQRPTSLLQGNIKDYNDKTVLDTGILTDILSKSWQSDDLSALLKIKNWSENDFIRSAEELLTVREATDDGIYLFKKQAFVFGYNSMKLLTYDDTKRVPRPKPQSEWDEWSISESESSGKIYLDNAYSEILSGSYISIQKGSAELKNVKTYKVKEATLLARNEYGISSKSTLLTLDPDDKWWESTKKKEYDLSDIRDISVYAQSEELIITDLPVPDYAEGDTITLNGLYPGLKKGQNIIVFGDIREPAGVIASELKVLKQVIIEKGYTVIQFTSSLENQYIRDKVVIYANVAYATHGETVEEILGSGDARKKFQKFMLKANPLTHISASTPGGIKSSLEIRVNDILWKEVESFNNCGRDDRIYITRIDNDSNTTVIFGDGITGARLPGGQNNIRAKYRKGIGLAGILKKDQLSQLMTKPLGVKSATNPMASTGGDDPENLLNARKNAPLSILSLGRVVSLQDYEDFARSFAGIEKSLASWSWEKGKRCIYLTVAGPEGAIIKKDSTVYTNLKKSIKKYSSPDTDLTLMSYRPRYFILSAKIKIKPEYEIKDTLSAVESMLKSEFSFDKREFGQPVLYSEIVSVIHEISGVEAVDIDELYYSDEPSSLQYELRSSFPEPGDNATLPAELLTLDPRPVNLKIME